MARSSRIIGLCSDDHAAAEKQAIRAIGGYDYKFVDAVNRDDYCAVCQLPARDPQQTKCECAKLFCKSCYDQYYDAQPRCNARGVPAAKCPTCGQTRGIFSEKRTAKRIKECKIKCPSTNCPWINQLNIVDDHLTTCGTPVSIAVQKGRIWK